MKFYFLFSFLLFFLSLYFSLLDKRFLFESILLRFVDQHIFQMHPTDNPSNLSEHRRSLVDAADFLSLLKSNRFFGQIQYRNDYYYFT